MEGPAARLKAMVVEDSPRILKILIESLQTVPGFEIVATADTAAEALAGFERHHPDVVILDLVLRAGAGLDVLREIKRRAPECRVVIFTAYDDEPYRIRCMAAGADGFFSKNLQHRQLMKFIRDLSSRPPHAEK